MSGNPSAESVETKARTAAGTSPFSSRSIAVECPALIWLGCAPFDANAARMSLRDSEYSSSIATSLPSRSDTDLISGRAITMATRTSLLLGGPPSISILPAAAGAATVLRFATVIAAATCSCIVLLLEFGARPTVGCAIEPAAAMPLFGASCVLDGGGGSNVRFAEGSVFALMRVGLAFVKAGWAVLSLARCRGLSGLVSIGGSALNDANSIGRAVVPFRPADSRSSVLDCVIA